MQTRKAASPSPSVAAFLRQHHGDGAEVSLETYVAAALYAPGVGYYRRPGDRIGYRAGRDFYTAESLGAVFAELVLEAVSNRLPDPSSRYHFVEWGAETPGGLLGNRPHPFASFEAVGSEEAAALAGPCVVFSNELFDAQPFRRFEVREGQWQEHGVRISGEGLAPVVLAKPASPLPRALPDPPAEGYRYDYPSGAEALLARLVAAPWHGLLVAFDYGLEASVLASERSGGTGRTYFRHSAGSDLLADPGERDITHHVCWDHLRAALLEAGFRDVRLEAQESFFVHGAPAAIERIVTGARRPGVHRDLQTLKELLHPGNMGRRFQVLSGFRAENTCQGPESG